MLNIFRDSRIVLSKNKNKSGEVGGILNLTHIGTNKPYTIKSVRTDDEEMKDFLFTLGCYEGESVTVISELAGNYVIAVKDARYSIDKELAEAIRV